MSNIETIDGPEAIRERLQSILAEASSEILLSLPIYGLPAVRDSLAAAVADDVSVLLLLYGEGDVPADIDQLATVARHVSGRVPLLCLVDQRWTVLGWPWVLSPSSADQLVTVVENSHIALGLFGEFVGNYWSQGTEIHVADPPALPQHYPTFRGAVIAMTLHLRGGAQIQTTCDVVSSNGSPTDVDEISGLLLDVRQGFVYPMTNRFPSENGLVLRVDGERVTVGGSGAFVEDYAADAITLERA